MEHYLRNAAVMPAKAWDDLIWMLDSAHIYRYDSQRSLAQRGAATDEATRLQRAYRIVFSICERTGLFLELVPRQVCFPER